MKVFNISSLRKNIQNKRLFLVINSNDFERKYFTDEVSRVVSKGNSLSVFKTFANKTPLDQVFSDLYMPSLLGGEPVVVYDEIEQLCSKDIKNIEAHLKKELVNGFLILGARKKNNIASVLSRSDQMGIVLDFSGEKYREKGQRLAQFVRGYCENEKKRISQEIVDDLIEKSSKDMATLEKELEKVITYIGDRQEITFDDLQKIATTTNQSSIWQLAEKIVWEHRLSDNIQYNDAPTFHSLVASIRYQLHIGYKLSEFAKRNLNYEDHKKYFPRMQSWLFQKRKQRSLKLR